MKILAVIAGAISLLLTVRGLIKGEGRGFRRNREPVGYWGMIALGSGVGFFLLYVGLKPLV